MSALLKCGTHDASFQTPEEFQSHLDEVEHVFTGTTKCADCNKRGIEIDRTEKFKGLPKARCESCLVKEEERVLERIAKREAKDV